MTYMYQADLWCDECGEEIRERLLKELPEDFDPDAEDTYDSDEFPKSCCSDGSDCPENCAGCGQPLDYTLTAEGRSYVLETAKAALENGLDTHIIPLKGSAEETLTWYYGMPHYEIVRDWVTEVTSYMLDSEDEEIVCRYLDECMKLDKELGINNVD